MTGIDRNLLELLRCPATGETLRSEGQGLVSESGRRFPVVQGVPVLFVEEDLPPFPVATKSWDQAKRVLAGEPLPDDGFLETVGISDAERREVEARRRARSSRIDPVVEALLAATGGRAFRDPRRRLESYPIPEFPGPVGRGESLLDVGSGWGRWCFAAERAGWSPVGIDPSLGAVLAARRVAREIGSRAQFVVGDGRCLPFRSGAFRHAYSFSVLQHFSDEDVRRTVVALASVVAPAAEGQIQMAGLLVPWVSSRDSAVDSGRRASSRFAIGARGGFAGSSPRWERSASRSTRSWGWVSVPRTGRSTDRRRGSRSAFRRPYAGWWEGPDRRAGSQIVSGSGSAASSRSTTERERPPLRPRRGIFP